MGKLRSHIRSHSLLKKKEYGCLKCVKEFGTKQDLKIHDMVHTGEKPYKCSQCEKPFKTKKRAQSSYEDSLTGDSTNLC